MKIDTSRLANIMRIAYNNHHMNMGSRYFCNRTDEILYNTMRRANLTGLDFLDCSTMSKNISTVMHGLLPWSNDLYEELRALLFVETA